MPALFQYNDGRLGSHGVMLCKDGQIENVPIDIANQYVMDGWSQDCSTIQPTPAQYPSTLPHVGSNEAIEVVLAIMLTCYVVWSILKQTMLHKEG